MKKEVFQKNVRSLIRACLGPVLFTAAVIGIIVYGLHTTEQSNSAESRRILEDGIRRAVVTCYAVEGSYPESLEYIETHYGVHIDRTKYYVDYLVFASNIMPDISVFEVNW